MSKWRQIMKNKKRSLLSKLNPLKLFNLRNVSISKKYIGTFSLATLMFVIAGTIVYIQLSVAENDIQDMEQDSIRTHEMSQLASIMQTKDIQISDFIMTGEKKYIEDFDDLLSQTESLIAKIEPLIHDEQQQQLFTRAVENDRQMNDLFIEIMELSDDEGYMARSLKERANRLRLSAVAAIEMLVDVVFEEQSVTVESANRNINSSI